MACTLRLHPFYYLCPQKHFGSVSDSTPSTLTHLRTHITWQLTYTGHARVSVHRNCSNNSLSPISERFWVSTSSFPAAFTNSEEIGIKSKKIIYIPNMGSKYTELNGMLMQVPLLKCKSHTVKIRFQCPFEMWCVEVNVKGHLTHPSFHLLFKEHRNSTLQQLFKHTHNPPLQTFTLYQLLVNTNAIHTNAILTTQTYHKSDSAQNTFYQKACVDNLSGTSGRTFNLGVQTELLRTQSSKLKHFWSIFSVAHIHTSNPS